MSCRDAGMLTAHRHGEDARPLAVRDAALVARAFQARTGSLQDLHATRF
jgi:hypothetical protein